MFGSQHAARRGRGQRGLRSVIKSPLPRTRPLLARPWWAGSAAVLTLGAVAGARFANTSPKILLGYLAAAFGSFAVAVTVAALFALVVVALLPFRIADVIVAFAPGAQDTMMVLALAMHLDPVYVGAHHLARFLAVSFSVAVVARRLVHREPTRPRKQWTRPGQGTFDD